VFAVAVSNVNVLGIKDVAGLAVEMVSEGNILDCGVSGVVQGSRSNYPNTGGLVEYFSSSLIDRSRSSAAVISGSWVGGAGWRLSWDDQSVLRRGNGLCGEAHRGLWTRRLLTC